MIKCVSSELNYWQKEMESEGMSYIFEETIRRESKKIIKSEMRKDFFNKVKKGFKIWQKN